MITTVNATPNRTVFREKSGAIGAAGGGGRGI
jgi:hypothetical protein